MFKFIFGVLSGLILGIFGSFVAFVTAIIALEDSPELRKDFFKQF